MMHKSRAHQIVGGPSVDEVHAMIGRQSWVLCTGFRVGSLLLLNDSTSEDALQEYALIKLDPSDDTRGTQVDSITMSWIEADKFRELMAAAEATAFGASEFSYGPWAKREHGEVCHRCA